MARNILRSQNAFVGMTNSDTAFHEYDKLVGPVLDTDLNLYNTVQSCTYSVGFPKQDLKQIGTQNFASRELSYQPDVELAFTYIPEPSVNNEIYGLYCGTGAVSGFVNFLDGRLEASTNFYIFNAPNQEDDALSSAVKEGTTVVVDPFQFGINYDLSGWDVISFGNCFPVNYGLSYAVGALPVVSTSYVCSNMQYEAVVGASGWSPAINLEVGNQFDGGNQIFNFFTGTTDPRVVSPTSNESSITLQNLQVGGQALSGSHFVQSLDMSVDLSRVSDYGLGNDFAYGRKAELPANGSFSATSLVSGFDIGELTGVLGSSSGYNFELVLAATGLVWPDGPYGLSFTPKMIYQIEDAKLISYSYSMPINNFMTFDAEFSFEITETKGLKLSGTTY